MKEEMKNIFLMGLGVRYLTNDKADELREELLKNGNSIYEEGIEDKDELINNIDNILKDNYTKEVIIEKIEQMSSDEKKEIMVALKKKSKK